MTAWYLYYATELSVKIQILHVPKESRGSTRRHFKRNINLFFAIEFFAVETLLQNFANNRTPQKNPVIRYMFLKHFLL